MVGQPSIQRHLHLIEHYEGHQRQHPDPGQHGVKNIHVRRLYCRPTAPPAATVPAACRSPASTTTCTAPYTANSAHPFATSSHRINPSA